MWASLCCSFDVSAGAGPHDFAPIPPLVAPPPAVVPAFELPTPQWWPIGVAAGTCKFTSNVKYNGFTIVLDGHDCGKLVPQITFPPNNLKLPIILVKSSRKVLFSAAKVRMNGAATACASTNSLPWMMLACGDPISTPFTVPLTNIVCPVRIGMTTADAVGGVFSAAATIAGDLIADGLGDSTPTWIKNNVKSVFAAAGGYLGSSVQHHLDPEYPLKGGYTLHLPGGIQLEGEAQWGSSDTTRHPSQVKTKGTIGMGADLGQDALDKGDPDTRVAGVSASAEAAYVWDAGDNEDAEGFSAKGGQEGGIVGVGQSQSEVEYKGGKVTAKDEIKQVDGSTSGSEHEYDDGKLSSKDTSEAGPSAFEESDGSWDML